MSQEKLGKFLREVSNWKWDEFVKAEHDKTYTSNQAMIFSLIRSCAMQKMQAITMSLNRLDGKLKTPVKIEMPKIFYLFPNALPSEAEMDEAMRKHNEREDNLKHLPGGTTVVKGELIEAPEPEPVDEPDLPSLSLRQTLSKMSDYPRDLPEAVIELAQQTEWAMRDKMPMPDEIPAVKSVVAAHLLIMAQKRDLGALSEVFDQIDGKLVETIQVIGEDIFITSYATTVPDGAELNKDGVYQMEATQAQNLWTQKLGGMMS